MNLSRKLEIVDSAIKSISTHEDEDAALRSAALDRVISMAAAEKTRIDASIKARIDAELNPGEPAAA